MKKKNRFRRSLSLFLTVMLLCGMLPNAGALADSPAVSPAASTTGAYTEYDPATNTAVVMDPNDHNKTLDDRIAELNGQRAGDGLDHDHTGAHTWTTIDVSTMAANPYVINTSGCYRITGTGTNKYVIVDGNVTGTPVDVHILLDNVNVTNSAYSSFGAAGMQEYGNAGPSGASPLTITDGARAWVTLEGSSHLESTYDSTIVNAAISVSVSSSLIFTEESGDNRLEAVGGRCATAIGGWHDTKSGFIQIDGGHITALAKMPNCYAGIGGGHYNGSDGGWCPGIVINGGTIDSQGTSVGVGGWYGKSVGASGVGPGVYSFIQINGGNLYAANATTSGYGEGAAIGYVMDNDTTPVHIRGGDSTVDQKGRGAGIGGCATIEDGEMVIDMTAGGSVIAGAGIGGSNYSSQKTGGDMYILGGKFQITADDQSAGIGGAVNGNGGNVTIAGGNFEIQASDQGAGIGGGMGGGMGVNGGNGGNVTIAGGDFVIHAGEYGAGIGGGGRGGNGGNVEISGGNFTIDNPVGSLGAGIGGGGTFTNENSGSGGDLYVSGGQFNVTSNGYGAAIGGAGNTTGMLAGTAGEATFAGGTVMVQANLPGSVGVGGGSVFAGSGGRTTEGKVTVTGGNIFTEVDTIIPGGNDHAYVLPDPSVDKTQTATKIEIPGAAGSSRDKVGDPVYQVAYSYQRDDGTGKKVQVWNYDYGTDDMVVTPSSHLDPTNTTGGELWVWVPASFDLNLDLTTGSGTGGYAADHSDESAYGHLYAVMEKTATVYNSPGQTKQLIQWGDFVDDEIFDRLYDGQPYADGSKRYDQLVTHPQDSGYDVAFVGWTKVRDTKIYAREESARPQLITEIVFSDHNETAFAVWGYDKNGNGIADINEENLRLTYHANTAAGGVAGTEPKNPTSYIDGDTVPISSSKPKNSDSTAIFMGWMDTPEALLRAGDVMPTGTIYGMEAGQTSQMTMGNAGLHLYALWGEDQNGNGIPDVQEPLRHVVYHLNGGTGTPVPLQGVDGVTVSLDITGAGLTAPTGTLFLGWSLDSGVAPSYGRGDTLPAFETNVTFAGADIDVYAAWGDNTNGNHEPDVYEPAYRLIYDPTTTDAVTNLPVDSNEYLADNQVAALDSKIPERTGWLFQHWTDTAPAAVDAYDATTAAALGGMPAAVSLPLTFGADNITLYAVWAVDKNNNGVPDWNDASGLSVKYSPTLSTVDLDTMPFPITSSGVVVRYEDDNGGSGYLSGDWTTTGQSGKTPKAPNRIFLGWSPVFVERFDFGSGDLQAFQTLLTFIQDIPAGSNNSGRNLVGGTTLVQYPQADYKTAQLDSNLAACTTTGDWTTAPYDWSAYQTGDGFLTDVRLPGFDNEMASFGGSWMLYATWATDINRNDIPDMFEETYTLSYDANGGSLNGITGETNKYPGEFVQLTTLEPGKLHPATNDALAFIGWTPDSKVLDVDFYSKDTHTKADLPKLIKGGVTFGSFDITLYAVWGEDKDQNGIADILEDKYHLTYDANGGTGAPTDAADYEYGDTVTLDSTTVPAYPGNLFLGWTEDDSTAGKVYTIGQSGLLPTLAATVTFDDGQDRTVYAVWSTDRNGNGTPDVNETGYTVSYDLNGGSGSVADFGTVSMFPGETVTISAAVPTAPGASQTFDGWKDQDGNTYPAGGTFTMPNGNVVLTAQYKAAAGQESITGKDFTYNISGGVITGDKAQDLGKVVGADAGGNQIAKDNITVKQAELDAVNAAIQAGQTGKFPLTFTTPNGASTTIQVTLTKSGGSGGGGGGSDPTPPPVGTKYTLTYEVNGGRDIPAEQYEEGTVVKLTKTPLRTSYTFGGWFLDKELLAPVTEVTMNRDITIYAKWIGGSVPPSLNGKDHTAYVQGYPDGNVRPNANITRAEVATIFYRLLDEDVRKANETQVSTFPDVQKGKWYSTAIATLEKMNIVQGSKDGKFHGDDPITRAEFATIAARFSDGTYSGEDLFTDISAHWGRKYINSAAASGWITGYTDGTFGPDRKITRAETMTLVNNVLLRRPETKDDLLSSMKKWPDNMDPIKWYYLAVQEATNSHEYTRKDDGVHETWTK